MSQGYSTALYQQASQFNNTTDLEHSTLASSDSNVEPEQAAGVRFTNQLQRETRGYEHVYHYLIKTNENTSRGRLVAAVETLSKISE